MPLLPVSGVEGSEEARFQRMLGGEGEVLVCQCVRDHHAEAHGVHFAGQPGEPAAV